MKYVIKEGKDTYIRCWQCETLMHDSKKQDNDGDCPECGVEIDLEEMPYKEETKEQP